MKATIIASEGGAGYYPENTAYAVRQSLAAGGHGCELDFHLTADGIFVAHHDYLLNPALARGHNGQWLTAAGPAINQTTLAELRAYDIGSVNPDSKVARRYPHRLSRTEEPIPTYQDIESAYREHLGRSAELWFEAKTDPFQPSVTTPADVYVTELCKILPGNPLFAVTVLIAFDWHLLELVQQQMPGLQTGFLSIDFSWFQRDAKTPPSDLSRWFGNFDPSQFDDSLPRAVKAAGGTYWSPYFRDLTDAKVKEAHDLGIKVSTWGADTEADIAHALAMGVDSLTTSYVDRV